MNLQPWLNGDLAGQEAEGYKDGCLHCKQGWCTDNSGMDTPYLKGYRRGWDDAKQAGVHGTEPIKRLKEHWCQEKLEFCRSDGTNEALQELAKVLEREMKK